MLCLASTTALALRARGSPRAPPPRACAPSGGHLFVAQGDLRRVLADAVLYPTTDAMDAEWFPDGAPGEMFERSFTLERRVQRLDNIPDGEPSVWLSWVRYQDPEPRPPAWFVGAVEQFLRDAFEWSCADGRRPLCGRQLPLLALPVVGTGESGAKPIAGDMIAALISLLRAFVATRAVDVLLVTKSRQMLSAAQATRRRYDRLPDGALRPWAALPPSLEAAAHRLAALARGGRLALFLGSGVSRAAALPGWTELLSECARAAGVGSAAERAQLAKLSVTEQATLLQVRLGKRRLAAEREAHGGGGGGGGGDASPERVAELGRQELQRLAAARLSCERYAVLHALLASLPHAAVVTTNSDLCYDAACAAAGVSLNVLPYDTRPSERWLLKLHGDVHHPEDIVLTYSSGAPYGADREALSGLVQALLITKHMLFVGFSLRDTSFNQVATTVRRALGAADDAEEEPSAAPQAFGSAITLSERPFLAELWPDLESIPVSAGVAADEADRAMRRRITEVLLDRVCLIASPGAEHVLAPTLAGTRTAADNELREELESLAEALRDEPACRDAAAFEVVESMLIELGYPPERLRP